MGLGGNLSYPKKQFFINSIGTIDPTGSTGDEFRLVLDKALQGTSASNPRVLFSEKYSLYMLGGANAKVYETEHADAVARVVDFILNKRYPTDEIDYELGLTVVGKKQKPGVYNDNMYGCERSYYHVFKYLDPSTSGYLSDLDLMRAYADINQQVTDDVSNKKSDQDNGCVQGVVDGVTSITFSADVSAGTFDVPAAGLYGKTLSQVAAYVDSAGTTTITNSGGSVTTPGYGFIVHVPGAETIASHKLTLTTKDDYKDDATFALKDFTGTQTVITEGSFEILPWEDVWREFAYSAHMAPFSDEVAIVKPSQVDTWRKFVLIAPSTTASIHGASHSDGYENEVVIYAAGSSTELDHLSTLLSTWAS